MSTVGIDKRGLRKIIRAYLKRGPVPESRMIDYLTQRYKLDGASVKRGIKNQLGSRRIESPRRVSLWIS